MRLVAFLLVLMIATAQTVASAGTTGTVNGFVRDQQFNVAVAGIRVIIFPRHGDVQTTVSDRTGFFSFASVELGPIYVEVTDAKYSLEPAYETCWTAKFTVWADQVSSLIIRVPKWKRELDGPCFFARLPVNSVPPFGGYDADPAAR